MQLVRPDINIDFVGMRKTAAIASGLAVVASLLLFFLVGPTWGIDFTGGTEVRIQFLEPTDIGEVRTALADLELGSDAVQQYGPESDNEFVIRIQDTTVGTEDLQQEVTDLLAAKFGPDWIQETRFDAQVGARMTVRYAGSAVAVAEIEQALASMEGVRVRPAMDDNTVYVELPGLTSKIEKAISERLAGRKFEIRNVDSVGPKVGDELKEQGALAILATLALILVYVGFRFEIAFAPGAVIALFHDVSITVGMFIILDQLGWTHEFNLPMIGALLTIIGYSLNDTIVIYDRVRENMKRYRRRDTSQLINASINETLSRTLATSITTALAMLAFLVLGGPVIETFALAILMGVVVGTYSTVFVATPMILVMEDIRPWFDRLFQPAAVRRTAAAAPTAGAPRTRSEQRRLEREARRRGEKSDDDKE
ncbi:MAG: protein translocase subunit SecF [Deltaproteobacteria bacterium]|nr:MAG: protein translocase subunit SecF [Deltaproteobacteria bacterium]